MLNGGRQFYFPLVCSSRLEYTLNQLVIIIVGVSALIL